MFSLFAMMLISHITYLKSSNFSCYLLIIFLSKSYVFATTLYCMTLVLLSDGHWLTIVIHKRVLHIIHLCDTGMAFLSAKLALQQV